MLAPLPQSTSSCIIATLGFRLQSAILAHMFHVISAGIVQSPIYDPAKYGSMDNRTFLQNHMLALLGNAFPHLQKYVPSRLRRRQCRLTIIT